MPQKPNKAGKMQEYIPKGNGDASGEYGTSNGTNKNFTTSGKETKANVINNNYTSKAKIKSKQREIEFMGKIPNDKLEEYNKKAVDDLQQTLGIDKEEAEKLHQTFIDYFGGDFKEYTKGNKKEETKIIDDALSKMPIYDGAIYRGLSFETDEELKDFQNYEKGGIINGNNITSWSSKGNVGDRYALGLGDENKTSGVLLVCDSNQSGVGVQHLSKWGKAEAEVLNPSTARWQVEEKQEMNGLDFITRNEDNPLETKMMLEKGLEKNTLEALKKKKIIIIKVKEV